MHYPWSLLECRNVELIDIYLMLVKHYKSNKIYLLLEFGTLGTILHTIAQNKNDASKPMT